MPQLIKYNGVVTNAAGVEASLKHLSSVDIITIWLKLSKIWMTIWPILPENLTKIWPFLAKIWPNYIFELYDLYDLFVSMNL